MTNRFTTLAAAAAIFLGFSAPAAAAGSPTKSHGAAGGWEIVSDSAGCAGSKVFANDTGLTFIFMFDGSTAISIGSEKWNIPKGEYPVTAAVDRAPTSKFRGHAGGRFVVLPWNMTADEANLIAYGAVLRVKIGSSEYAYRLDGSAAMLRGLVDCINRERQEANPFAAPLPPPGFEMVAPTPANPFAETRSNPYRRM
jgi:hypothetical protein